MDNTLREKAFNSLVQRHKDMIWHLCQDYPLSAAWEVEDAFQEVMMVLWRDFETFEGKSSEKTWVYRLATTTLLMLKRKMSNKPQDDAPPHLDEAAPDMENFHALMQLVENLREPDRGIVRAFLDGFDYKEIAEMLGMSAGSVAMRLTRAKKKLKKQYTDLL